MSGQGFRDICWIPLFNYIKWFTFVLIGVEPIKSVNVELFTYKMCHFHSSTDFYRWMFEIMIICFDENYLIILFDSIYHILFRTLFSLTSLLENYTLNENWKIYQIDLKSICEPPKPRTTKLNISSPYFLERCLKTGAYHLNTVCSKIRCFNNYDKIFKFAYANIYSLSLHWFIACHVIYKWDVRFYNACTLIQSVKCFSTCTAIPYSSPISAFYSHAE